MYFSKFPNSNAIADFFQEKLNFSDNPNYQIAGIFPTTVCPFIG